jgi:hypothetical protein
MLKQYAVKAHLVEKPGDPKGYRRIVTTVEYHNEDLDIAGMHLGQEGWNVELLKKSVVLGKAAANVTTNLLKRKDYGIEKVRHEWHIDLTGVPIPETGEAQTPV